ncbi:MAG: DUF3467 domain-containing protein [Candidatus Altiarchaeota archaeon]
MAKNNEDRPVFRVPDYKKFYATNVYCGLTEHDFRIEFMNEKEKDKGKWSYVSDGMLILSPLGAKRLHEKLGRILNVFEKENGVVETKTKKEKTY